jgi:hypothetical protein
MQRAILVMDVKLKYEKDTTMKDYQKKYNLKDILDKD